MTPPFIQPQKGCDSCEFNYKKAEFYAIKSLKQSEFTFFLKREMQKLKNVAKSEIYDTCLIISDQNLRNVSHFDETNKFSEKKFAWMDPF